MRHLFSSFYIAFLLLIFGLFTEFTICRADPPPGNQAVARWILACRVEGQGFGCFPGDSSFVTRTGMAVETLEGLGMLDALKDKTSLIRYLKSMQQPDGGFIEAPDYFHGKLPPWGTMSALEPTWWAIKTLIKLGAMPDNPEGAKEFIMARQFECGAWDSYELGWNTSRTRAMLYSTFWAVAALRELGASIPDSVALVRWVGSMRDPDPNSSGYSLGDRVFVFYSPQGAYYAVRTLDLLGDKPDNPAAIKKFLLSDKGQEADGGFEMGQGDGWNNYDHFSRMVDTYAAVNALDLLGLPLSDSDSSKAAHPATDCVSWVVGIQNSDGGFPRFGVTSQTPLPGPSEMRSTWQAVAVIKLLDRETPVPKNPVQPVNEVVVHRPKYLYPAIDNDDPAQVWAYRRIALPIYNHFLEKTGSRIEALGGLTRWARAAVGPMNAAFATGGRSLLMHGFGQCGQMSQMLQLLASSVDHAARFSYITGDITAEILVREDDWDRPHWCLFIPFTNEWPDPDVAAPDGSRNGWSALDLTLDYRNRRRTLNYPSRTEVGDNCFISIRVETVDHQRGTWGREIVIDTTSSYTSAEAAALYPGQSW